MKKLVLLFIGLTFVSCDGVDDDLDTDFFECTVDFVQFVDDETNYYYGRYAYDFDDNDYAIGEDLVYIRVFLNSPRSGIICCWKSRFLLCEACDSSMYSFAWIATSVLSWCISWTFASTFIIWLDSLKLESDRAPIVY